MNDPQEIIDSLPDRRTVLEAKLRDVEITQREALELTLMLAEEAMPFIDARRSIWALHHANARHMWLHPSEQQSRYTQAILCRTKTGYMTRAEAVVYWAAMCAGRVDLRCGLDSKAPSRATDGWAHSAYECAEQSLRWLNLMRESGND